jgi:hypothetical protein
MKKLAIAVTGAFALAGIGAGITSAVNPDITVQASINPIAHGSKKKPKKTKLVVKLRTTPNPAEPAFAASDTIVHLGNELQFNGNAFKTCASSQVLADDTKCPKGSKVGKGIAAGTALGLTENLTVTAYNGPGGNTLLLLVDGQTPLQIHSVIPGILSSDSAPYGKKLSVHVPDNLQQPAPGAYATLVQFDTTINAIVGKKKKPYVGVQSCADKTVSFGVDYKYTDGTSKSTTTTAKCK